LKDRAAAEKLIGSVLADPILTRPGKTELRRQN
jgi:hypothetical protein